MRSNLPLILGLAIPVLMIGIIAAIIYGNALFSNVPAPTQDFVYAIGDNVVTSYTPRYAPSYPANACAEYYYRIASGTLQKVPSNASINPDLTYCKGNPVMPTEPMFFVHHVKTNTSEKLTFEQMQALHIDDSPKSSEGYEYTQDTYRNEGIFPFFGGGNYDPSVRYLKNGTRYEKMTLQIPSTGYYGQDVFLGWVKS